ncbi:class A beta-lactamase-related serine hydrolase [bacterium M00.F.Ca.ET.228.01.1.1]|uniref:serine hydrolase domain-containing protein n=2 Tax=Pseudomonadota TaxID=1224 RepID=UPI0010932CF5|nr:serine hydrolase domain-containing protein [Paraburkholderia phenoliruptrix]TGP47875.1 class A beta-lactamase-related serine hydrolase [bacterium M00.F.Ca.ET.228.01.1.1]TGS05668.1 class A beta-lactamase-related serine hydrolase [bacterium M00.F.Ca.ET.191.01.1.1]TGU10604.1 class A beta-lactamase-related serine hydrolase [bacterium M00.F.Ca.ET.155.01.1.1]MBW0445322.1 beta-lactamase family protein [Paraburkholderia phenoliruptrix]MBW9096087.1 beta-lactamase family protein [Paraburkholderia phe
MARCKRNPEGPASEKRRQFLGYTGAGLLATVLPGCGNDELHSAPYQQTIALGQQMIRQAVTDPSNPVAAISVAMVKGSTVVWQEAFGVASVPGQIQATPQTRFNIGSVSKLFPALAAAILVDRGLIALDTPIVKYLPTFTMLSPEYAQITTRHLLSHASGLPGTNGRNLFTFEPVAGYAADTQAELANSHLKHLPGELAVYCNDGFTMVEQIVLAVTGQSFVDFVQSEILAPLNMTHSSYLTSVPSGGSFSLPYVNGTQHQEFVNAYATGGLSSTPADMMNLAQMIYGGGVFQGKRIVSAAGIAQMGTDQTQSLTINPSPEWRWGLGWDSVVQPALDAAGVRGWEKDGGTAFYSTEFFVVPNSQFALLVTGNSGYNARAIAETLVLSALKEDGTISSLPAKVSTTAPPAAPGPGLAGGAGIYGNSDAPYQVLANADGSLQINQWDADTRGWAQIGAYRFRTDGWWWSDTDTASYRLTVVSGNDSEGNAFHYRYLMKRVVPGAGYAYLTLPVGQQLAARAPLDSAWQQRVGTQWTLTNDSPSAVPIAVLGNPPAFFATLAELPGYVLYGNEDLRYQLFVPVSDTLGGMSIKVPGNFGRDLYDIRFASASATTLTIGSSIYSRI